MSNDQRDCPPCEGHPQYYCNACRKYVPESEVSEFGVHVGGTCVSEHGEVSTMLLRSSER